jgi:hypothetical protein
VVCLSPSIRMSGSHFVLSHDRFLPHSSQFLQRHQIFERSTVRHTDSDSSELKRIWKEVIMAKFKVLCHHLPGGPEESNKPSKNSRDLNHGCLEYVTGLLPVSRDFRLNFPTNCQFRGTKIWISAECFVYHVPERRRRRETSKQSVR